MNNNKEKDEEEYDDVYSTLKNYIEEPHIILESYFKKDYLLRLSRHQIESYNHFINYQLKRTVYMFNPVLIRSDNHYVEEYDKYVLETSVFFENVKLQRPVIIENNGAVKTLYPHEAKLRNFTYGSNMTSDLRIEYILRDTVDMNNPIKLTKSQTKVSVGCC